MEAVRLTQIHLSVSSPPCLCEAHGSFLGGKRPSKIPPQDLDHQRRSGYLTRFEINSFASC
jgi:hypothetical protein